MRICLVSSSFYPATFYGGPISATWDLSKKITEREEWKESKAGQFEVKRKELVSAIKKILGIQ